MTRHIVLAVALIGLAVWVYLAAIDFIDPKEDR